MATNENSNQRRKLFLLGLHCFVGYLLGLSMTLLAFWNAHVGTFDKAAFFMAFAVLNWLMAKDSHQAFDKAAREATDG